VRHRHGIEGSVLRGKGAWVEDALCAFFCGPCVLQQVSAGLAHSQETFAGVH